MTWRDQDWKGRIMLGADLFGVGSAGSPPAASQYRLTVPATLDLFWDNVKSGGEDVRITGADGVSDLSFKPTTWDYANRSAVLDLPDTTLYEGDALNVLWLYFGNDAASAPTYSAHAPGTPRALSAYVGGPGQWATVYRPPTPGVDQPEGRYGKTSAEARDLWFNFRDALANSPTLIRGRRELEELQWFRPVAQTGDPVVDVTATLIHQTKSDAVGRGWFKARVRAGDAGTDYTVRGLAGTTAGQTFDARAIVQVRDPDET